MGLLAPVRPPGGHGDVGGVAHDVVQRVPVLLQQAATRAQVTCPMSHVMSHITTRDTWHVTRDKLLLLVELSKILRDIFTINVQKTHNRPSDCGLL